jgi:2-polyprenyl-3-methyl-5-hydroxy-6-metoxy-1,4-benzoquinol methylase
MAIEVLGGGQMGQEQDAEFYNGRLGLVGLPIEQSPWLSVYAVTADLLPAAGDATAIADLGCGTGRLAKILQMQGHSRYWGFDFSSTRIEEARRYVPEFEFTVDDAFDVEVHRRYADFSAFVALEILEHVENDLGIIESIPSGAPIVFSVPNFDSEGHVRTFKSPEDARARYEHLLEFNLEEYAIIHRRKPRKKIFVLRGVRR